MSLPERNSPFSGVAWATQHPDPLIFILLLTNRHTYTYGIWEGIGVCIGVPAKRGQLRTQRTQPKQAVNCHLWLRSMIQCDRCICASGPVFGQTHATGVNTPQKPFQPSPTAEPRATAMWSVRSVRSTVGCTFNDKTSTSASRGSPWCWDESLAENAVEGQDDKKMDYRGGHGVRGGFLKVEQQQTTEVCFRSRVSLNRDNRTTVEQR